MDDIKNLFWYVFIPRGQTKHCKHTIIGTPISQDDLLAEIEKKSKEDKTWGFIKKPAIIVDSNGGEESLWKERYSLEELYKIRLQIGNHRFAREYLLDPTAEGQGFYPKEMILNCTADDMGFSYNTKGMVVIGADFAMSDAPSGDYNVFTVVEYSGEPAKRIMEYKGEKYEVVVENPVTIRNITRYRGSTGQVRMLLELQKTYKAVKLIVDSSTFGNRFAQELREFGMSVDAQDFRPTNRASLLTNLRKLMESDDPLRDPPRLIIPTKEEDGTLLKTRVLMNELSGFNESKSRAGSTIIMSNQAHDDTVMSLALAAKDATHQKAALDELFVFSAKKSTNI